VMAGAQLEPELPADTQAVVLAVPTRTRVRGWLLAADVGRRGRGHDRVQQPENRKEQLFHELAWVECRRSARERAGAPGNPSAQVVHAGEDLALVLGLQDDGCVADGRVLPHIGLNGLPVDRVPERTQDGKDVRQGGSVAE
jgi:hypothetical protein